MFKNKEEEEEEEEEEIKLYKQIKKGEFSAYGIYSGLVKMMIDKDKPKSMIKRFYESFKSCIPVKYYKSLEYAMVYLNTIENGITATTVSLKNNISKKLHSHAICILKKNSKYYLFDPNGAIILNKQKDYYMYFYGNNKNLTTTSFVNILKDLYNIKDFVYEDYYLGIQTTAPDHKKSRYINRGGFCMFYLFLFIQYILENWSDYEIESVIKYNYEYDTGVFPKPTDMYEKSKDIIENIFRNV
jgi:hypothetical protein